MVWSKPLVPISSVFSANGTLHTSIHLERSTHLIQPNEFIGNGTLELVTRSLNGTLPGPARYVNPGDTLILDFFNNLVSDPNVEELYHHNTFCVPNESNLHFHGLHVSGELPSDDVTLVVKPGEHFQYVTTIPEDHLPGTHFVHPHRHGSTSAQVGGGAVGVIVVQDTPEMKAQLPTEITEAPEVVVVIQEIDLEEMREIAEMSNDTLFQANWLGDTDPVIDIEEERFYTMNGQVNPSVSIPPNQWVRFRIVNAGWAHAERVNLELPGCEMQLIAKDGVYLPILPRRIHKAEIVNAGRSDIMIQCPFADDTETYQMTSTYDAVQPILTLTRSTAAMGTASGSATVIPRTTIVFPEYLQDLRDTPPTTGCSCTTEIDNLNFPMNGAYFHETYQGAVVERYIAPPMEEPLEHPYHQHVHPFQLVDGVSATDPDGTEYYQIGDWHDTMDGEPTIRFKPTVFTGKMMIHCHNIIHEDEGLMAIEYIHPKTEDGENGYCTCGVTNPRPDEDEDEDEDSDESSEEGGADKGSNEGDSDEDNSSDEQDDGSFNVVSFNASEGNLHTKTPEAVAMTLSLATLAFFGFGF